MLGVSSGGNLLVEEDFYGDTTEPEANPRHGLFRLRTWLYLDSWTNSKIWFATPPRSLEHLAFFVAPKLVQPETRTQKRAATLIRGYGLVQMRSLEI